MADLDGPVMTPDEGLRKKTVTTLGKHFPRYTTDIYWIAADDVLETLGLGSPSATRNTRDAQFPAVRLLREILGEPCVQDEYGVCAQHEWMAQDGPCAASRARQFLANWDRGHHA